MAPLPSPLLLLSAIAACSVSHSNAFAPTSLPKSQRHTEQQQRKGPLGHRQHHLGSALSAMTVEDAEAVVGRGTEGEPKAEETSKAGSMIMDLDGIAFSGLKGQALSNREFPKANEVRAVIPKDCFEVETAKSLSYLSVSAIGTALCTLAGVGLMNIFNPASLWTWPLIWAPYAAVTGTVAMGLWVLAHECGHGAFSKNRNLQDGVGYVLHSLMLVPYFSWQRSHAVHHRYTNHMELGETHVPEPIEFEKKSDNDGDEQELQPTGSYKQRSWWISKFGRKRGMQVWGGIQMFLHLVIGWPGYLLIGATGGPDRGLTNHFYPNPLTTPKQPRKELFPGNWKEKVYQSDIGIAAVVGALVAWTATKGLGPVMALYGAPLLVVNAWLVLYTWLQHTDVDVPHFSQNDKSYNFVKGAFHTIDRPYDKLDPWGLIDFLHHRIGSTHVAHHFDCTIPHYKAQAATEAIKQNFPEVYLYDPTPIPQALWRVAKGCTAVEERGDATFIWKNDNVEEQLEYKP